MLYWENHLKQFMLGSLPVDKSDYLATYIDIYVCIYINKHIYLCMCKYIYICHQIELSTGIKPSMNCIPWYMVFPVQHSYLDTSTSKVDYIIPFLGLWELYFARKTIHTSWPSFSLVSKMSDNTQCSPQSRDILRLSFQSPKHSQCI